MTERIIDRINRLYRRCPECSERLDRKNRILCDKCEADREKELTAEAVD